MTKNSLITTHEANVKIFEEKFTFLGDFSERKFSHFLVTNYKKTDPIIPAEDIHVVELKSHLTHSSLALLQAMKDKVEGMKKQPVQHQIPCPDGKFGCLVYHCEMRLTEEDEVFNSALSQLSAYLEEAITKIK